MTRALMLSVGFLIGAAAIPAFAADQAVTVVAAAPSGWNGIYAGLQVGYLWGAGDTTLTPLPSPLALNLGGVGVKPNPTGAFGGGQIGFNHQNGTHVWGIEADIAGADIDGTGLRSPLRNPNGGVLAGSFFQSSEDIDWLGTVRLRAGLSGKSGLWMYATGGVAFARVNYAADTAVLATHFPAATSATKTGWTAGFGGEWAFRPHWSMKLEYLYYDLGSESVTANPVTPLASDQVAYTWNTHGSIVRFGLNWKFGP